MIITALPASHRRFSSPSSARRSRKPMSSRGRQSSSDRRACARPAHTPDQTPPLSSVPPATIRPAGLGTPISAPAATFKSP